MTKKRLVALGLIAVGLSVVLLSLNQPAMAKERVIEFINPGCE